MLNIGAPPALSWVSKSPLSTLRAVITPSNGAFTCSNAVSACSRSTVACCAFRLASATATPASALVIPAVWTEKFAVAVSAFCLVSHPWPAKVVSRYFVTFASLVFASRGLHLGLRLQHRRLVLPELGLRLLKLLVEVGGVDAQQQVAGVDTAADIDPPLRHIAGGARVEVGDVERLGLAGQGQFHRANRSSAPRRCAPAGRNPPAPAASPPRRRRCASAGSRQARAAPGPGTRT